MTPEPLTHAPSAILRQWLDQAPPDSDAAAAFRRELDKRYGERDEEINERQAAKLLGIPRDVMRRIAARRLIRPIREYAFEYRFSRREIERWRDWTDREGPPNA